MGRVKEYIDNADRQESYRRRKARRDKSVKQIVAVLQQAQADGVAYWGELDGKTDEALLSSLLKTITTECDEWRTGKRKKPAGFVPL